MNPAVEESSATPLDAMLQGLADTGDASAEHTTGDVPTDDGSSSFIPCIQVSDSPMHKDNTVYTVELFGSGCLECTHLVEDAEVEYKKCHFLQGNTACPAAYIRIGFIGERVKWENRVRKALDQPKGPGRTARILALLDDARGIESDSLREHVLGMLGI